MTPKKLVLILLAVLALAVLASYLFLRNHNYEITHAHEGEITEAVYGLGKVKSNHRFEVIIGVVSTVSELNGDEGRQVRRGDRLIRFESAWSKAPFDGTITYVAVRPGETALPHVPLLRLEDLRSRYIEISLEQEAALRVNPGQTARISLESLRGTILEGRVVAVYPRQDEFLARVEVDGLAENVLPGMTADVTIEVGRIPRALLVPLKALHDGNLSVRRSGRWTQVKVDVGFVDAHNAEIKGGLLGTGEEIRLRKVD